MRLTSSKTTKHLVLTGLQLNFIDASGRCVDILWKIALITHMSTVTFSLIPKKNKNLEYLSNWRPISLLNNDRKITAKVIALRIEKVLPKIIHSSQTGYVKGRYILESIKTISDIMSFTKTQNIPGLTVSLDFEKVFDSIE